MNWIGWGRAGARVVTATSCLDRHGDWGETDMRRHRGSLSSATRACGGREDAIGPGQRRAWPLARRWGRPRPRGIATGRAAADGDPPFRSRGAGALAGIHPCPSPRSPAPTWGLVYSSCIISIGTGKVRSRLGNSWPCSIRGVKVFMNFFLPL